MAKLAKPKAKTAPKAPKKPTSRSKTGNAECSAAASTWQLSLRGKATATSETYQTLAKCRALASGQRKADAYGRTGKLSDQGAAALKGRLQKRFDSGLITAKSRQERLEMLLKQRKDRAKPAPAPTPARYSLGGQLAPGRGTEERKQAAREKWQDRPQRFLMSETYLTASGEPFHVMTKRFGVLRAFPLKDGKPVVNRDSGVMFAVTDSAKARFPEYRTDLTNRPMKPARRKLTAR